MAACSLSPTPLAMRAARPSLSTLPHEVSVIRSGPSLRRRSSRFLCLDGNMTSAQKLVSTSTSRGVQAILAASTPDNLDAVPPVGEDGHILAILILPPELKLSKGDTEAAGNAPKPVILVLNKPPMKPEQVVQIAKEAISHDAGRSNQEFLNDHVLVVVINAGATTLTIPDRHTLSLEFAEGLIVHIKAYTAGTENAIISTHCQNDIVLASAKTVVVVSAGELQLEVTISTSGKACNASLEEDLNGMLKFKGTSQTTSSCDIGSTLEIEFDNGNLSGSDHDARTELAKAPISPDLHLDTMNMIFEFMVEQPDMCKAIIHIVKQKSPEFLQFMWQMAQPFLRVLAFFGIGFTLAVGFIACIMG